MEMLRSISIVFKSGFSSPGSRTSRKIDRWLEVLAVDDDADDGRKPNALCYKRQSHAQSFIIRSSSEASSSSVILQTFFHYYSYIQPRAA